LIDNWLRHVQDVRDGNQAHLAGLLESQQVDRLCELNVVEQVSHVCETTIVQDAWSRAQPLAVHGWIYGLRDGLQRDLHVTIDSEQLAQPVYRAAMAALSPARVTRRSGEEP